jgi:hypothetical protein
LSGIGQRIYFGVALTGSDMKTPAQHLTIANDKTSHARIGRARIFTFSRKLYRGAQVQKV